MTTAALLIAEEVPARPVEAAAAPWIASARFDLFFTLLAWLLPLALWAVASTGPSGLLAAALVFLLVDTSHQVATLPITLFDREVFRANRTFYLVGLAGLLATACIVATTRGVAEQIWASLFMYWGVYHLIRQHLGFLRLYQARGGMRDRRELTAQHICLYSGTATAALFHLSRHQPMLERAWIFHLDLPDFLWQAALAVFLAATLAVIRDCLRRRERGEPVAWLPLGYLALVMSNFWLGLMYAGRDQLIVGVFFISAFHDFQYYAIVWLLSRRRHAVEPRAAGALSFAFRGRSALPYLVLIFTVGAAMELVQQRWTPLKLFLTQLSPHVATYVFAVFASTQYLHFYLDHRAWRLRSDARLRRDLLPPAGPRPC